MKNKEVTPQKLKEALISIKNGLEEIIKLGYGEIVVKIRSGKISVIEKRAIVRDKILEKKIDKL